MVAETELRLRQGMPVMDIVQYRCVVSEIAAAATATATAAASSSESAELVQELDLRDSDAVLDIHAKVDSIDFVPSIRSGSFADIGNRTYMEDEHLCVDDLAAHLGSRICCPTPSAFYGVFDGHGGPESAIFLREHAMKFFFEDSDFPRSSEADDVFLQKAELSLSKSFLLVDDALADDLSISSSSGTTGLTVLLFGRVLLVANVGDCRAVLCRKGEAIDMSEDHRPVRLSELRRVEAAGGYIDDGYLNGVLSVTRALGDWDVKFPRGSSSPLIADPEFRQAVLTEEDEFLIIGCDGIWDVMSSQHAVGIVRRGLRRHDDPAKCARELVLEALRLNTSDNLTAIVVCFTAEQEEVCFTSEQRDTSSALASPQQMGPRRPRLRCCSLSAEALCKLNSWLNDTANN